MDSPDGASRPAPEAALRDGRGRWFRRASASRRGRRRGMKPAGGLGRIWIRFGLWIAGTVGVTIGLLAVTMLAFGHLQYRSFERDLPPAVREELAQLVEQDREDSPEALAIYGAYWRGDLLFGEKVSLLLGLAVCLPFGFVAGFWVSRTITLPLDSVATAAQRIAEGDLSVRADPGTARGEMAELVGHFNAMAEVLERFERDRKVTAAAISHELRTPLTILQARLYAGCDGVIEPTQGEFRRLLAQVEHLGRLVDDLHTLSMAEAGRLPLQLEALDLVALAGDALQLHAMRLSDNGIAAHLEAGSAPVVVEGDADRLRQVLSNLIENVFRHAQQGGWLQLGVAIEAGRADLPSRADSMVAAATAETAVLTVSDAGPGLSEEARRTLFQYFNGPPGASSRAAGGSGLGLSIVQMLVTQHGGEVSVDRSARGGTRFTVRLPLIDPAAD